MLAAALLALAFATPPGVGETAPDFDVTDIEGRRWKLSQMVEEGPVVLAFFPKAFTGG